MPQMVSTMADLPRNVLSMTEVSKSFGDHMILDELTFGLAEGDVCGIIGANGTGKSTLLKIMAQEEPPDGGTVAVRKGQVVAYLPQTTVLPKGTVADVLNGCFQEVRETIAAYQEAAANQDSAADDLLGRIDALGGWDWEHRMERAASLLSLTSLLNEPTSRLSGGESKRVALAHLMLIDADIVLLDEPTNHLDADTVEWLERWISESNKTFIVITHDRYFLDHAVSQISELREGKLFSYPGALRITSWRAQKKKNSRNGQLSAPTTFYECNSNGPVAHQVPGAPRRRRSSRISKSGPTSTKSSRKLSPRRQSPLPTSSA